MIPEDTLDAVMAAIDGKLASTDPLTIEDPQTIEKLSRARMLLERASRARRR